MRNLWRLCNPILRADRLPVQYGLSLAVLVCLLASVVEANAHLSLTNKGVLVDVAVLNEAINVERAFSLTKKGRFLFVHRCRSAVKESPGANTGDLGFSGGRDRENRDGSVVLYASHTPSEIDPQGRRIATVLKVETCPQAVLHWRSVNLPIEVKIGESLERDPCPISLERGFCRVRGSNGGDGRFVSDTGSVSGGPSSPSRSSKGQQNQCGPYDGSACLEIRKPCSFFACIGRPDALREVAITFSLIGLFIGAVIYLLGRPGEVGGTAQNGSSPEKH